MDDFVFRGNLSATADPQMINPTVQKLWSSFCLGDSDLILKPGAPLTFCIGGAELPVLGDGKEYALRITETGAAIVGRDYGGMMRGFCSLLMKICCRRSDFALSPAEEESCYKLKNRMIHICVFPENDPYFIKKLIRLAGICQYTHVVIEFWGMLQYDCLKELAWPQAFSKEEAKELVRECRELGMEPIPMFNQLGHASAGRVKYGKHVVLDQNPRLQHLFTPDGWSWDIHSEETRALLKNVRRELYEVFGEGEYLHVGCDEAYYYTHCDEERRYLPDFLSYLTDEVVAEGRRPMVWMDMLLERGKFTENGRTCATCVPEEVDILQNSLNPKTVMVDWQYNITASPVPSLLSLKGNIRDAMGAPWYDQRNYAAHVDTIAEHGLFGIMMTTWHKLKEYMPSILGCAKECGAATFPWAKFSGNREVTAALLRRLSFEGNTYEDSGWSREQIEI